MLAFLLRGPRRLSRVLTTAPRVGVTHEKSITVARPRVDVYRYWRDLPNLSGFMSRVRGIETLPGERSRWVTLALGRRVEWVARVIEDVPGERFVWATEPGSGVRQVGAVSFKDAPGQRGTEVRVVLRHEPPGGRLGTFAARLLGTDEQRLSADLKRFKQLIEAGEIARALPQPTGRRSPLEKAAASLET